MSEESSRTTKSHRVIRKWVEQRGGRPATVRGTGSKDEAGVLRIDFPGYKGKETLEHISWDEFFEKFDEKSLVFLYQDTTANGKISRFCKFVGRENTRADRESERQHDRVNGQSKARR